MKKSLLTLSALSLVSLQASALTVDFDSFGLDANSYADGPTPNGDVTETTDPYGPDTGLLISTLGTWEAVGGVELANNYSVLENPPGTVSSTLWNGVAISTVVDTTTPGYGNQYAAFPGGGASADGETVEGDPYGVVFATGSSEVIVPNSVSMQGLYITNTTYAALAMQDGDSFSRKFEQGDWFQLTVIGLTEDNLITGERIFFLADFRSSNTDEHYILEGWEWLDLRELGHETKKLQFSFYSSDTGDFGINTPTYLAIDNLVVTPQALASSMPAADGWSISPWFGIYYDDAAPWIYQQDLGWLYLDPISVPEDMLFYNDYSGWSFTSEALYPWIYSYDDSEWYYVIKDTDPLLFYVGSTGEITTLTGEAPTESE